MNARTERLARIRAQFAAIVELRRNPDPQTVARIEAAEALDLRGSAVVSFDAVGRVVSVEPLSIREA